MSTISQFTPAKLKAWIELYSAGATGPEGPEGPQGPAGSDGSDGADGADGADGDQGPAGADGTDGTNGTDGTDGIDGTDGNDGAPGADGVDGEDGDTMWDTVTGGIRYTSGNVDVSSGNLGVSGNLTVSSSNASGGGIILSDDGDIVDLNDSYCSMRFSGGVRVFSTKSGGTPVHTLASNGNFTSTGTITATTISSSGTGGINFSSYGGGWYMADTTWVRSVSNKRVYNGSTNAAAFATPGDFTAGYSDMRLKTHKGKIEHALDKVCTLDGFYYERNEKAIELGYEGGELRVGLSAQQVKEVLPEIIKSAPVNIDHGTDYMTLDYERVVPLLVEAIKELKAEVEELKNGTSS